MKPVLTTSPSVLVLNGLIIAVGTSKAMQKLRKQTPGSFVGKTSREKSAVGNLW